MPDMPPSKGDVRARALAVRAGLPASHRAEASQRICEQVVALPEVAGARSIAAYVPVRAEVDITGLLRAVLAGDARLWLPWVEGTELHLAAVEDLDTDLVAGWQGVPEPAPSLRGGSTPPLIEVAVVPGVAFDRRGQRLGYGGGHFDRLLSRRHSGMVVVAVAFAAQVIDEVPHEPHDVRVDIVVTEGGVLRIER